METCCFRAKHPDAFPIDLPPGAEATFELEVKAHSGPFEAEVEAFVDTNGSLTPLVVPLKGVGVKDANQ